MKPIITSIVLAVGLALCLPLAQAKEKEREEENLKSSDVPGAVQKTGETQAKGGTIVRWEKEGSAYEVVVDKGGKQWGIKIDASGKVLGKHDESKEKGEKGEKY
jgi:plastocyanin